MYAKPVISKRGKYGSTKSYQESKLCHIPKLGLSCFGCCGNNYDTREKILKQILKNTNERSRYTDLLLFRDRHQDVSSSGVCTNVVYKDKNSKEKGAHCPLHPKLHNGKDLREGYCQIHHLCKGASKFNEWSKEKQKEFLIFLKEKKDKGMDWFDYSMGMDSDSLLREFESSAQS